MYDRHMPEGGLPPAIQPDEVELVAVAEEQPPARAMSSADSHIVRSVPQYEVDALVSVAQARQLARLAEQRLAFTADGADAIHRQREALQAITSNMQHHLAQVRPKHDDLIAQVARQTREHGRMLDGFELQLEALRDIALHPLLVREGRATLHDCLPEEALRKWRDKCARASDKLARITRGLTARFEDILRGASEEAHRELAASPEGVADRAAALAAEQAELHAAVDTAAGKVVAIVGDLDGRDGADILSGIAPLEAASRQLAQLVETMAAKDADLRSLQRDVAQVRTALAAALHQRLRAVMTLQTRIYLRLNDELTAVTKLLGKQETNFRHVACVWRLPEAYEAVLLEVPRRRAYRRLIDAHIAEATDSLSALREKEEAARAAFRERYGCYLPGDFIPGLEDRPALVEIKLPLQCELPRIGNDDDDAGDDDAVDAALGEHDDAAAADAAEGGRPPMSGSLVLSALRSEDAPPAKEAQLRLQVQSMRAELLQLRQQLQRERDSKAVSGGDAADGGGKTEEAEAEAEADAEKEKRRAEEEKQEEERRKRAAEEEEEKQKRRAAAEAEKDRAHAAELAEVRAALAAARKAAEEAAAQSAEEAAAAAEKAASEARAEEQAHQAQLWKEAVESLQQQLADSVASEAELRAQAKEHAHIAGGLEEKLSELRSSVKSLTGVKKHASELEEQLAHASVYLEDTWAGLRRVMLDDKMDVPAAGGDVVAALRQQLLARASRRISVRDFKPGDVIMFVREGDGIYKAFTLATKEGEDNYYLCADAYVSAGSPRGARLFGRLVFAPADAVRPAKDYGLPADATYRELYVALELEWEDKHGDDIVLAFDDDSSGGGGGSGGGGDAAVLGVAAGTVV
eukprot:PLAT7033.8.p1 GENE.PLAT7033.8~~PLAT7033.8.p1  ORF type:complete len:930 (+),score=460.66 PLAT7033.8:199-2790(+)